MVIKKNLPYIVIMIVVLAGAIFGVYKILKPAKTNTSLASNGSSPVSQNGTNQQGAGRQGSGNFHPIQGTVQSINSSTLVITKSDNSTQNVITNSSTRFTKFDSGTRAQIALADIKVGDTISVMSMDSNATGDITARMVIDGQMPTGGGYGGRSRGGYNKGTGSSSSNNSNPAINNSAQSGNQI